MTPGHVLSSINTPTHILPLLHCEPTITYRAHPTKLPTPSLHCHSGHSFLTHYNHEHSVFKRTQTTPLLRKWVSSHKVLSSYHSICFPIMSSLLTIRFLFIDMLSMKLTLSSPSRNLCSLCCTPCPVTTHIRNYS